MIIVDEMPFSTVDRMGFKKLCKVLESRFKLPSRYTLMKDCVKLYMQTKDTMKIKFSKTGQRVCLTTDTWTSIQNMNYMCITGHSIDPSWKYQKKKKKKKKKKKIGISPSVRSQGANDCKEIGAMFGGMGY
jgi:hypothetical protein